MGLIVKPLKIKHQTTSISKLPLNVKKKFLQSQNIKVLLIISIVDLHAGSLLQKVYLLLSSLVHIVIYGTIGCLWLR